VSKTPVYHQKPAVGNCYSNASSYTTENQKEPQRRKCTKKKSADVVEREERRRRRLGFARGRRSRLGFRKGMNFQWQKSFKNQYLSHFESKSYQINSIKSYSYENQM
jgi:hypothetical protein